MHKQFFRRITWVLIAAGVAIGAYIAVRRPGSSRWIAEITFACCNTPCGEAASRGDVDVRQTSIPRRVAEELVNRCLPSDELRNEIAEIVSSKLQVRGGAESVRRAVDAVQLVVRGDCDSLFTLSAASTDKDLAVCVVEAYFAAMVHFNADQEKARDDSARRQLASGIGKMRRDIDQTRACIDELVKSGRHPSENLLARLQSARDTLQQLEDNLRRMPASSEALRLRQLGGTAVFLKEREERGKTP